jgi:hypothetical protein
MHPQYFCERKLLERMREREQILLKHQVAKLSHNYILYTSLTCTPSKHN